MPSGRYIQVGVLDVCDTQPHMDTQRTVRHPFLGIVQLLLPLCSASSSGPNFRMAVDSHRHQAALKPTKHSLPTLHI